MGVPIAPGGYCCGKGRRCPNKATHRGRCYSCHLERQRAYDDARPSSAQRGYDARWQATRREYLDDHPTCECEQCLALPVWRRPEAVDVHHKDGLGPLGPRGHDPSNLMALTHEHHARVTAVEQAAGWNRRGVSGNL